MGTTNSASLVEEKMGACLRSILFIYVSRTGLFSNKRLFRLFCLVVFSRSMLMTACDLGAVTKPWEISRQASGD